MQVTDLLQLVLVVSVIGLYKSTTYIIQKISPIINSIIVASIVSLMQVVIVSLKSVTA